MPPEESSPEGQQGQQPQGRQHEPPAIAQKEGFPREGDLVLCEINSVNPNCAFARLEEYKGLEGMIHIAEISTSWVKNIRSVVKEGKKVVCLVMRVDPHRGHINLSLKRVSEVDKRQKFEQVKRARKTARFMELVAQKALVPKGIIEALERDFTEAYFAFEEGARRGAEALAEKGLEAGLARAIAEVGAENISFPEVALKASVTVSSYSPDGLGAVKKVLAYAEKAGATVSYISAPKYRLALVSSDYKSAEKKLRDIADSLAALCKKEGCDRFDFSLVKEGNKEEEVRTG